MSAVKYSWPENRLRALLTRPGGMTREEALAGAAEQLEECRPEAAMMAAEALAEIESIIANASSGELSRDQVYAVLQHTERLSSIAATFDWKPMARVTSSLGELGMSFLDAPQRPAHPIAVHVRAARWAADNMALSEEQAAPVLDGLLKVVARFAAPTAAGG